MGMNDMLRKMAVLLERRQDALFSYDVSKQKKYIAKLGNPRDEIERSYFQYKCQMQFNGKESLFVKSGFISSGDSLLVQIWKKGSGESARA